MKKTNNKSEIKRPGRKSLFKYALKYWKQYLFTGVMLFVAIGLNALTPIVVQHIVDDVVFGKQLELLMPLLGMLLAVGVSVMLSP